MPPSLRRRLLQKLLQIYLVDKRKSGYKTNDGARITCAVKNAIDESINEWSNRNDKG